MKVTTDLTSGIILGKVEGRMADTGLCLDI